MKSSDSALRILVVIFALVVSASPQSQSQSSSSSAEVYKCTGVKFAGKCPTEDELLVQKDTSSRQRNECKTMGQIRLTVRPILVETSRKRRKTAWFCQERGKTNMIVQFYEDFANWTRQGWKWRTEDIGKLTLLFDFQPHHLKVRAAFGNHSLTTEEARLREFSNLYLSKVTNESCYEVDDDSPGDSVPLGGSGNTGAQFSCVYWGTAPKKPIPDVYVALLFIASCFLLVTVTVYVIIWDTHTVHGWIIFSEVLSNFFMILTVGLSHWYVRDVGGGAPSGGCFALALISHFFFLSTFFWMTVINFNLWKTFRRPKASAFSKNLVNRNRRLMSYIYYAAFAMGVPFLFVLGSAIFDILMTESNSGMGNSGDVESYQNLTSSKIIHPHYGRKFCYMAKEAQGHFIYYPIGTVIVTNVVFFSLTAHSLLKHRRETKVLYARAQDRVEDVTPATPTTTGQNRDGLSQESPTQSIVLFAKLFCVMGVSWVFEIFAWAFSGRSEDVPVYWIIYDVTNLVQGIAVFVIFVCKRETLVQLKGKFRRWTTFFVNLNALKIIQRRGQNQL